MASNRMIRRETKRKAAAEKYAVQRKALRKIINDPNVSLDEKFDAQAMMNKLPRDSSPCRQSNRCNLTGRARGVERYVGLCRHKFLEFVRMGLIPGFVKSSW